MRIAIIYLFLLCAPMLCNAQNNKENIEVSSDIFLNVEFEENKLALTENGRKMLNQIGEWVVKINNQQYDYYFEVVPSLKESEKFIEYKRVDVILKYLRRNYKLKSSMFKFIYHEAIPIEGLIRFNIE